MNLTDLKINEYAIILFLNNTDKRCKTRLLEMGIVPGTIIKKTKTALFNDPIAIELRGYELCISRNQATYILIEKINL